MIRQVIQTIQVGVQGESEQVNVTIAWVGGAISQAQIIRPVAKWAQLSYYPQLCERLRQLVEDEWSINDITDQLNQEGFRPPKQRQTFNRDCTRRLMQQLGLRTTHRRKNHGTLAQYEWWLADLALCLGMPSITLYNWVRRGWVQAKQHPGSHQWIIWADETELERLKRHRQQSLGHILHQRWQGNVPEIAVTTEPSEPAQV